MNIYNFNARKINGEEISFEQYKGKVLLIVNSATGCGFTPQYDDLEKLYKNYKEKGLEILDFPSNQFGAQTPGTDEEVSNFCSLNFGVSYTQFSKTDVNGENAHPLFLFLQKEKGFSGFDKEHKLSPLLEEMLEKSNPNFREVADIKWNFTKFLIDRNGKVITRLEPTADISKIEEEIKKLI